MINTNKVVDNLKFLGLFVAAMIIMVAFMAPVRIPEWVRIVIIVATVAVMLGVNIVYDQKFAPARGKKWVHSSGWDGNLNTEAAPDEVKVEISKGERTYLQTEVWQKWECPSTAGGASEEPHQHTDECFMEASKKCITWHIGKNG